MSIPGILGITLENLPKPVNYLNVDQNRQQEWLQILGPKTRMRVGFCWSGRRDAWLNRHKGMPFEDMLDLIKTNSQYEWVNLQIDATPEEEAQLVQAGVLIFPGSTSGFADTAGQLMHMDVVVTVDTAVAHLAGALGRPTWIMLNKFAVDWRWLVDRNTSPWYSTALLFRQEKMGDWSTVCNKITKNLKLYKI
jgi:ADP-heptose:LPS heptosyltransferase